MAISYQSSLSAVKWSSELKRAKSRWIQLKFPSLTRNLKDDRFHNLLSRRLHYHCAEFAQYQCRKARQVAQLKILIPDYIFVIIESESWANQVVTLHNQFRAEYGAQAVTWSQSRYTAALAYAKKCVFEHRYEKLFLNRHKLEYLFYFITNLNSDPQGQYGENLVGHLFFSKIRR